MAAALREEYRARRFLPRSALSRRADNLGWVPLAGAETNGCFVHQRYISRPASAALLDQRLQSREDRSCIGAEHNAVWCEETIPCPPAREPRLGPSQWRHSEFGSRDDPSAAATSFPSRESRTMVACDVLVCQRRVSLFHSQANAP